MFGRKRITQLSDNELLEDYRQRGKQELVGELYKRYAHLAFGVCMKYLKSETDAEDAVMQVFEKLLKDLLTHEVAHFKSWLFTVTRNHCLMQLRKQKQHFVRETEDQIEDNQDSVALAFENEAQLVALERAIDQLSPEQQKCIRLFYLEQKSYKEVADVTGYDMKKVKSFLQNGKRNLQLMLTKNE